MSVQILTEEQKNTIFNDFIKNDATKASLARQYGVSERTIGRILEEMDEKIELLDLLETYELIYEVPDQTPHQEPTYSFFMDDNHIFISENGSDKEFNVYRGGQDFDAVITILSDFGFSQDGLREAVLYLLEAEEEVLYMLEDAGIFRNDSGLLVFESASGSQIPLPNGLSNRINKALSEKDTDELQRLGYFTEKLFENPSNRCVRELFDFLLATNIKLDDSGYVIAYKRVTEDFKDVYTRKFDNSPGKVVRVDRNQVDEDSNRTCSYGLHICSKSYLNHYSGERVIRVLVHPADFVAIPEDYYDGEKAKARVCQYDVLDDVTDQWREGTL
jgi:hypothetical protein